MFETDQPPEQGVVLGVRIIAKLPDEEEEESVIGIRDRPRDVESATAKTGRADGNQEGLGRRLATSQIREPLADKILSRQAGQEITHLGILPESATK